MATFKTYDTAGSLLGTLDVSSASWHHAAAEDGAGSVSVNGTVTASHIAEQAVVRVNDGTSDVFAFVPTVKTRVQNEKGSDVVLSGPGVRWLLHQGQVLPEDTSDCAEPSTTRWFGWMSSDYDDSSWTAPASHGTWGSQPFPTARPDGWPSTGSEYLWSATGAVAVGEVYFRAQFTTVADKDVVVCASADDEYRLFLDGREIFSTIGGGPFQWETFQQHPMKLCAGTHTIAIVGRNIARPNAATNIAWVIAGVFESAGDGKPDAANHTIELYTNASSGSFTARPAICASAATINYDDTAAEVQTALEALSEIGAGNIDVSGAGTSGDPWVLEFVGALANQNVGFLVLDSSGLTGGTATATETQAGRSAVDIIETQTTDWVHLAYPASPPGLTPGEVLRIAVEEVQDRGVTVFDDFTFGFSDTVDTDAASWTTVLNLPVNLPADVHRLAVLIEESGIPVDMYPDLELNAWEDRGTDLSGSIVFTAGSTGCTDVVAKVDETTIQNVVRTLTDEGWYDATDATSVSARGRIEGGLSLSGWTTQAEAEQVTDLVLADLATPQKITTLTIASEAADVPYADFDLGDIVSAPGWAASGFSATDMRVVGITGRLDEASIVWTLELVD